MKTAAFTPGLACALLILPVVAAQSQVPGMRAFASTECSGTTVQLTVDLTRTDSGAESYAGWVVVRETIGACEPPVTISSPAPFPVAGSQQYELLDDPPTAGRNTVYRIYGVDGSGNLEPVLWNQRTMFAQADCVGGPAARGTITEPLPGYFYLEVCPGECWWAMSAFDEHLPAEAPELVGQQIDVFGSLMAGPEGPYIEVTGWAPAAQSCASAVVNGNPSWSDVKARFR